jgi:hypothetical protein
MKNKSARQKRIAGQRRMKDESALTGTEFNRTQKTAKRI